MIRATLINFVFSANQDYTSMMVRIILNHSNKIKNQNDHKINKRLSKVTFYLLCKYLK